MPVWPFIASKALGCKISFIFGFGLLLGPWDSRVSEAAGPMLEKLHSSAPGSSKPGAGAPRLCWAWPCNTHRNYDYSFSADFLTGPSGGSETGA